jgi:hypothetical protein
MNVGYGMVQLRLGVDKGASGRSLGDIAGMITRQGPERLVGTWLTCGRRMMDLQHYRL